MPRIYHTSDKAIVSASVGQLSFIVTGSRPLTDQNWPEFITFCAEMCRLQGPFTACFNYSPVVGPSIKQRGVMAKALEKEMASFRAVALVSGSAIVRGAITALGWLGPKELQIRPFAVKDADAALVWLSERSKFDLEAARELFKELLVVAGPETSAAADQKV